ncbi:MAG: ABC transporter permease subunit [Flavobacteriaceae bacterium]|nr:ABC transporter permease subunit [Flavobacteriaceae bacterium]
MLRLLSIEYQKLKHNTATRFLILAYFVLICFISLLASVKFPIGEGIRLADMGIFNFPFIWHFNSYIVAILKIFLAIVIVSLMSNEYSYRTLKQNLIDGLSKKEFVLSKFYMVLALTTISTLFLFVVSLVLGLIFSSYNEAAIIFSELDFLLAYFVKLIGFFAMCLFLGVLVKRSAFALGFLFVWYIVENIFLGIIAYNETKEIADAILQFFPLTAMSNLIEMPFMRLSLVKSSLETISGESFTLDYRVSLLQLLIVIAWTAIFIGLTYKILKKRDL